MQMCKKILSLLLLMLCIIFVGCDSKEQEIIERHSFDAAINAIEYYKLQTGDYFTYEFEHKLVSKEKILEKSYIKIQYNKKNDCISVYILTKVDMQQEVYREVLGYVQYNKEYGKYVYTNSLSKTFRISEEKDIFKVFEEMCTLSLRNLMIQNINEVGNDEIDYKLLVYLGTELFTAKGLEFSAQGVNKANQTVDSWFSYKIEKNNLNPINLDEYTVHPFQE